MYKVVAFDFDATISTYDGVYRGDGVHGEPIRETVKAMRLLRERGFKLIIYSTKSTPTIRAYCEKHSVPYDYINENPEMEQGNPGKPRAHAYVDDRAINFHNQSAEELAAEVERFEPYYKKPASEST